VAGEAVRIGVLALQGGFSEHAAVLRRLGIEAVEVRTAAQIGAVDGLIIPGGESTTIGKLMLDCGLRDPLRECINDGLPVFGTCAGAIVLARDIGGRTPIIGSMDISVRRNAFGRQLESFEESVTVPVLGDQPLRAVFIRAPAIDAAGGGVQVLARLRDGSIVAARQGSQLATTFHPELTEDDRVHRYFMEMVRSVRGRAA
jgi:pyridoxal 5'-phosphate synthase pdxT subunit